MTKVAFLGLGNMGYPMAGYLSGAGYQTTVYNRTKAKAEKWLAQYDGTVADTPADAVVDCDFVFSCVGADNDLRDITIGDGGVFAQMKSGSVFIDHTTVSHTTVQELYAIAKDHGIAFADAPVSGGQEGAEKGQLTIMCGGDTETIARATPVMQSYARYVGHMGDSGAGQLAKMINQIASSTAVLGVAEGMALGEKAGLDMDKVFDAISKGAAGSWQMENRWHSMAKREFDFGFAISLASKDLAIATQSAQQMGLHLPTAEHLAKSYQKLKDMGYDRDDASALIRLFDKP